MAEPLPRRKVSGAGKRRVQRAFANDSTLRRLGLTLSAGLAAFPDRGLTSHGLLEAADRAMYRVKRRGGNNIAVA